MLSATPRVWLALLVAPVLAAAASAPPSATNEYALKVWETDDGLPHNAITTTLQRADGYLWVATQGGLVRFDGLQFTPVQSPLINGPKSAKVLGLAEEDGDTLLVASGQSGLLRYRDGALTVHPITAQFRPRESLACLFGESANTFWLVFSDREAWRWQAGNVQKFPAPTGVRPMYWTATFARDRAGNVYLARGAGVERYVSGRLVAVENTSGAAITLASSAQDGVWFAAGRRLARIRDGAVSTIASPGPWNTALPPQVMFEDRAGALWVATNEGLVRWQDGVAVSVSTSHVKISDLRDDDEGNLWISTGGGGLNRLQRTRLTLVAEEPDWIDNPAGTVCEDALGNIWFANRKGVRKLSAAGIESMNTAPGWPRRVLVTSPDTAGNVWFAAGGDLFRMAAQGGEPPVLVQAAESGAVHAIFAARDGSVWVGGNMPFVRRYPPGAPPETIGAAQGFTTRSVRTIGEDAAGAIWFGTEDGKLFRWQGGKMQDQTGALGGTTSGIRAIHGDAEGNLWLGTAGGGLALRHGEKFVRLTSAQGLPDDVISQILEDDFGWLWFGSRRGIFKIRKTDLLARAAGGSAALTPVTFGRADGLSGISAVGSYQPTAWKTRSGQLWFLTRRGLVKTDPARHENEGRLPRVYLDGISVDGQVADATKLALTSAARRLEFRFVAPTFIAPERVRFRYRLEGFDADWVDAGTQRVATYPALRPGRYVFTVNASNGDLGWNPVGASLAFDVRPMWWETWWARALALGLILAAVVVLVRYWSHRRLVARLARLEQEQRVERERVRIARDLHDDLGASLTHAGMLAEELAEDWADLPDAPARSGALAARVRGIARDLDAVVWTVSPKNDSLASLAAYISHFAEEYFRNTPIACRAHTTEGIPGAPLTPEVRHHLFLIAKELFNNVLKHSRAGHVEVRMQIVAGIFELTVADDGCGFSPEAAAASGRNGLVNLRARAREAGGTLDLATTPQGTVATLQFRVAPAAAALTPTEAASGAELPAHASRATT